MVVRIKTEVLIEAAPAVVFGVLQDIAKFEEWNPWMVKGSGEWVPKAKLNIELANGMKFQPTVLIVEPSSELRWLGKGPLPCLFDGEHYFVIEEQENGHSLLKHGENFSGMLPHLMPKLMRQTKEGFIKVNEALKARCEAMDP